MFRSVTTLRLRGSNWGQLTSCEIAKCEKCEMAGIQLEPTTYLWNFQVYDFETKLPLEPILISFFLFCGFLRVLKNARE